MGSSQAHGRRREIVTAAVREPETPCPCLVLSMCGSDRPGTSCHSWLMFPRREIRCQMRYRRKFGLNS